MKCSPTQRIIASIVIGGLIYACSSVASAVATSAHDCDTIARLAPGQSGVSVFLLAVAVCFMAYGALVAYREHESLSGRAIRYMPIIALAAAMFSFPINGHDVSFYASAGRAVQDGVNVYTEPWGHNNWFLCDVDQSRMTGMMYGPIAVRLFAVLAGFSSTPWMFIIGLKIILALALATMVLLLRRIVSRFGLPEKSSAVTALVYAQPMLLWQWVGSGQFDVLWVVTVLLAVYAALQKQWWLVIVSLTIGIWIKFLPIFVVPWFVLWWWQSVSRSTLRREVMQAAGGLIGAAIVSVVSWIGFWNGFAVFDTLILQSKWAVNSFFSLVYYSLRPVSELFFGGQAHWVLTRLVHASLAGFLAYLLWPYIKDVVRITLRRLSWTPERYVQAMAVSLLLYLMVWQKSLWPWYISWWLPFGILMCFMSLGQKVEKKLLMWLSVTPLLFYVVWFAALTVLPTGTDPSQYLWFTFAAVLSIWGYPVFYVLQWRRRDYRTYES